ncbi:MAG: fructosamine kinase family protein [Gammaproteobacteria bacterium]|nr:fructosamine kinase family protein [Gammaproteobacteria bacterium]MBU6510085.1 fructosamine kinase family protein [Gammaproteobacteria bacterium]MDE1984796.1 fructosamine kinase family protein [Gammaproteobacteria bacterium]MDE2461340.1 fructosamine kinase family protein [Gammaproteobacteria bacterium]
MPDANIRSTVEHLLSANNPGPFRWRPVGHGVGGALWRVQSRDAAWCVKAGADDPQMLIAEADGLKALAECGAVRVPNVFAAEEQDGQACLLMEWLDFEMKTERAAAKLGERLAQQHRCLGKQFGWRRNNFIGATPQFNTLSEDWVTFFGKHRLGFQLRLAAENGYRGELQENGARLQEKLSAFFSGYSLQPSLLHGDLWSGNWGALPNGEPVIFDPAVYYGDREADLAMTELFGGFPAAFYSAYNSAWPFDPGYRVRRDLYNLYHVLNHLNLFGEGYRTQAEGLMAQLLAETS